MKRLCVLTVCALLLTGCGGSNDADEEQNPLIRQGLEQVHAKNWDAAVENFRKALDKHPDMARPHLELALIYHQHKANYIRAIYHYERYLEKRPDTEKKPLILDWIRQARISLAADIGQESGGISEELIRLKRENNLLRKQLEAFRSETAPALQVTQVETLGDTIEEPAPTNEEPVERIQTPPPAHRTYKVLPGDTLSRIAKAMYGDSSRWRDIYNANRNSMDNENDLKAGQTIVIPNLEN